MSTTKPITKVSGGRRLIPACGYVRMSTDRQVSIPTQKEEVEKLAKREGYAIVKWYEDSGLSASMRTEHRLGFMELVSDAKSGAAEWKVVLCYDWSRFSRLDLIEEGQFKEILREADKQLHTVIEGLQDWNTSHGRIVGALHSEAASNASVKTGGSSLRGKVRAFRERKYVGQRCPYGYARRFVDQFEKAHHVARGVCFTKPKEWTETLVPGDDREVETVRWIFQTFVSTDVSCRQIAISLNVQGIPAPNGGKWQCNIIRRIIRQVTYIGDTVFGKSTTGKFARFKGHEVVEGRYKARLAPGEPETNQGTHEGIISRETWDLAQAKINRAGGDRGRRRHARGESGYALSGIIFCGHCNGPMYPRHNIGRGGYVTYLCATGHHYGPNSGCTEWSLREFDILFPMIGRLTDAIDMSLLALKAVRPPESVGHMKVTVVMLERKLEELGRKIKEGAERALLGRPENREIYDAKLDELRLEREVLKEQIVQAKKPRPKLQEQFENLHGWFSAARKQLIDVQPSPDTGCQLPKGEKFTVDSFRETLKRFGCRVTCWRRRLGKGRPKLDRAEFVVTVPGYRNDPLTGQAGAVPLPDGNAQEGGISQNPGETANVGIAPSGPYSTNDGPLGAETIRIVCTREELLPKAFDVLALKVAMKLRAQRTTLRRIAEILNEQGCPSGKGQPWNLRTVQSMLWKHSPDRGVFRPRSRI